MLLWPGAFVAVWLDAALVSALGPLVTPLWLEPDWSEVEAVPVPVAPVLLACDESLLGVPYAELVAPWSDAVAAPLDGWLLMDPLVEPCAFVSVPVLLFALLAVEVVAVLPCAFACVPAVEPVVSTVPDLPSFDDVRVLCCCCCSRRPARPRARDHMRTSSHSSSRDFSRRFLWGRRMKRREIPGCFAEVGIAPPPRKLLGRPAGPAVDVLEGAVLARCPSCRNTFSTDRPGRQDCPVCGKPLVVPEPPAAPPTPGDLAPEPAGTPWERRAELGFFTAWMQTLQQALLEPGKLFASARLDRGAAQLGFAVLNTSVFWALGQLLERPLLMGQRDQLRRILEGMSGNPDVAPVVQRLLEAQLQAGSPSWVVALALLTPVFTFLLLYVNAALTHGIAVILGQAKRGFPATFAACAYACAPLALLAVPACGSIVGLIWLVALTAVGMKVTHRISTTGAAASVLAPYFVLCCLMLAAFGTLTLALRRAVGQP